MRPFHLLLITCFIPLLTNFDAGRNKKKKPATTFEVSGQFTSTSSYCSGAYPSDAILQSLQTPHPLIGMTINIKKGKTNNLRETVFATCVTDTAGKFKIKLPPGDYCIVEASKLDSSYYNQVLKFYGKATQNNSAADVACLNEWLKTPLISFTVADQNINHLSVNIHHPCSWDATPCVAYFGPLPP